MVKNILFTMTCFLSRPDKFKQAVKAFESIKKQEPNIKRSCYIVLINECGETSGKVLKKQFKWIDKVIDKTKSNSGCGQPSSLNLAIDMLKKNSKFKYWLHWEESWVAKKPFLNLCKYAMDIGVDQLQLTEDQWQDDYIKILKTPYRRNIYVQTNRDFSHYSQCKRRTKRSRNSKKLKPKSTCKEENTNLDWPLWSLRPSMDNAERVLQVGYFTEQKQFWPVHFEIEWAYNWATLPNIIKAGAECAYRQKGHRSFSEENI